MATNTITPAVSQVVVQDYFKLVQAIASKIKRRLPAHVDVEDLVQTGMIGLLEASRRFDPSRQVDFSSYANTRITGAILDQLRKWDNCSRQDRKTARQAEEVRSRLRAEIGHEPSREQIAEAVGLGLAHYERTLQNLDSAKQPTSSYGEENAETTDEISQIPTKDDNPYVICSKREDSTQLRSFINQLKPRYRDVLHLYYFKDLGLKAIGERLGVGEARISQIHSKAIIELRKLVASRTRVAAPKISSMIQ